MPSSTLPQLKKYYVWEGVSGKAWEEGVWAGIRIIGSGRLSVAEFLPHNSAINPRFQSEIWPIFENHAIKGPAHLGILRMRGGSSWDTAWHTGNAAYSPHTRKQFRYHGGLAIAGCHPTI